MKRISIFTCVALFAAAVLLLGTTGCARSDEPAPAPIDINAMEQELIGVWWDEFEYHDVTETGEPFSWVLLAVEVNEDHTGCLYAAVFNDTDDEPVAIYGGYDDAGFTWQLLEDGRILLGDPETGETYALARAMTRAMTRAGGSSYGNNMTDASSTKLSYSNGKVTATNGDYSGTLNKADAGKAADIGQKLRSNIQSNVDLGSGGYTPSDFNSGDIR